MVLNQVRLNVCTWHVDDKEREELVSATRNSKLLWKRINTFSTQPFFIYAQNIMVYNLTAYNYVSLKDNPYKVYIKLKGIGCSI